MKDKLTVYLASDHAGYELKNALMEFLDELGYSIVDKGAFSYNEDDDYPDFILPVAEAVAEDPERRRGIILGASGQGEAIAANRVKGVRAAVYYGGSEEIVRLSREHNDANVLSLGARFLTEGEVQSAVKLWLETPFSDAPRHVRRIEKIDQRGS